MALIETLAAPQTASLPSTADDRKARSRIAQAMMMQGMDSSPVQHWTQGAARVAQALVGGSMAGDVRREEQERERKISELLGGLPGIGGASPATPGASPETVGAAPQAQVAQGPSMDPRVSGTIRALIANPETRAMGMQLYGQHAKPQTTDDIKEYERAKTDPAFKQYQIDIKRAGAINNQVQIDQRGETEFSKSAGKNQAERFDKIAGGGLDAKQMIADIQALRDIGGRITTGKTAEITAALGPYAEALGVKVDGLDDMQAYKAIISKMAPRMRVPGSGSSSDIDVRMFLDSLPGLGKTPGGNEIISSTFDAMAQHKVAASEIASKALTGEITRSEAEKQLRALPDPLTLWKKAKGSNVPLGDKGGAQTPIDDLLNKYAPR